MSRDKDKTTAKKSYSKAVSPKKEETNPFLSLSDRYTSFLPLGRKMTKKSPKSVFPSGSVIETQAQVPKEPTLQEKLAELVPAIGTATGSQAHEIMRGLKKSYITLI